jgi:hypothetical protein
MKYKRMWYRFPPQERVFALIYSGCEYVVAQWEPFFNKWIDHTRRKHDYNVCWHPLPNSDFYHINDITYALSDD